MPTQTSLMIIAICQMVFALVGVVVVIALIWAVRSFKKMISNKMDEAMGRVQPVVDQARSIAEQARETAESVGRKVDTIMAKAEDTADRIGEKVQTVSSRVEEAVNPQVAAAAGVVGAIMKAVQLYQDVSAMRQSVGGSSGQRASSKHAHKHEELSEEEEEHPELRADM